MRSGKSIIGSASGIKNNFTEFLTCESILDRENSIPRDKKYERVCVENDHWFSGSVSQAQEQKIKELELEE